MMPGMEAAGTDGGAAKYPNEGKIVDLLDFIERKRCYARNEDPRFPHSNLFIGDSRLGCKSDADEQLIVHIAFNQFVKVSPIVKILPHSQNRQCWLFLFPPIS